MNYFPSFLGGYLCVLGEVKAADSGTVALNFSKGKYIGLGIPTINHFGFLPRCSYPRQTKESPDEYTETIPSTDWVSFAAKADSNDD